MSSCFSRQLWISCLLVSLHLSMAKGDVATVVQSPVNAFVWDSIAEKATESSKSGEGLKRIRVSELKKFEKISLDGSGACPSFKWALGGEIVDSNGPIVRGSLSESFGALAFGTSVGWVVHINKGSHRGAGLHVGSNPIVRMKGSKIFAGHESGLSVLQVTEKGGVSEVKLSNFIPNAKIFNLEIVSDNLIIASSIDAEKRSKLQIMNYGGQTLHEYWGALQTLNKGDSIYLFDNGFAALAEGSRVLIFDKEGKLKETQRFGDISYSKQVSRKSFIIGTKTGDIHVFENGKKTESIKTFFGGITSIGNLKGSEVLVATEQGKALEVSFRDSKPKLGRKFDNVKSKTLTTMADGTVLAQHVDGRLALASGRFQEVSSLKFSGELVDLVEVQAGLLAVITSNGAQLLEKSRDGYRIIYEHKSDAPFSGPSLMVDNDIYVVEGSMLKRIKVIKNKLKKVGDSCVVAGF